MNNLEEIALRIIGCTDCELSQGRNKAVPGAGEPVCAPGLRLFSVGANLEPKRARPRDKEDT